MHYLSEQNILIFLVQVFLLLLLAKGLAVPHARRFYIKPNHVIISTTHPNFTF